MWSPGAVDFFRILNEQTQVVAEVNVDTMLLRTGQAAVWTMHDFQAAQRRHINDGLGLEMLCAVMNNNLRCYSESLEFAEQLEEKLADEFKGEAVGWAVHAWSRSPLSSLFSTPAGWRRASGHRKHVPRVPRAGKRGGKY